MHFQLRRGEVLLSKHSRTAAAAFVHRARRSAGDFHMLVYRQGEGSSERRDEGSEVRKLPAHLRVTTEKVPESFKMSNKRRAPVHFAENRI